jgi:hypothetical protein
MVNIWNYDRSSFRGLVMGILDIFEEHYFDLTIIKLPLTVLIAQIIYHLFLY